MKIEALQKIINSIRRENGEGFEVDQKEIEKAFSVEESAFSNITIKVLSVAGGILAAVLLTGFLFIAGISNSSAGMIITGVALTAVSIIAAKNLTNLTLDTMSITLYVVGVVMISAGFENIDGSHEYLPFILLAIAITTLFFSEGFMLVFAGTLLFHGALVYYFADRNLNLLIQLPILLCCLVLVWITVSEARIITFSKKANIIFKPIQAGFFVAFTAELLFTGEYRLMLFSKNTYLILSVGIGISIIVLLYRVMRSIRFLDIRSRLLIYTLALAVIIPTVYAPYIGGAFLLLILSFHYGYTSQLVISILLLIYGTSRFYYNLHISLLAKSAILFTIGVVVIGIWFYFTRQIKKDEKI